MKSRKDIVREYKERKHPAGIFIVKNAANQRFLLGSSLNIEGPLNKHKFMLQIGSHRNTEMQKDWKEFGSEAFTFEVLEIVEHSDKAGFDIEEELQLLEEIWIEKLQPFGEKGYNREMKLREA